MHLLTFSLYNKPNRDLLSHHESILHEMLKFIGASALRLLFNYRKLSPVFTASRLPIPTKICGSLGARLQGSYGIHRRYLTSIPTGDCPGCGAPFQTEDNSKPGYYVADRNPSSGGKAKKETKKNLSNEEYRELVANLDPEIRSMMEGESDDKIQEEAIDVKEQKTTREVCQRCYMLDHHNKPTTTSTPEFLRATQQYGSLDFLKTKTDPLTVAVIDVTDLPGSLGQLPQLLSENPGTRIMVAANKMDILPSSARKHEQRIKDWIVQHLKRQGIPTNQILSVSLISAKKGWGVPTLMKRIDDERRPTDDIYLVGCTNVGKSALVNRLMSQIRGTLDSEGRKFKSEIKAKYKITSSPVPGTTMGTIKIPLHALGMVNYGLEEEENWKKKRFVSRDRFLIDTPGVINDQQLIHQLGYNEQKKVVNQKEMNPVTYKLEPGKSLILKPLIRVDLLESDQPVLMTLFSPLAPHMTRTAKLPPAEAFEATTNPNRRVKDESILRIDSLEPIPGIVKVSGEHRSHGTVDFSFSGVGWVTLAGVFDRAAFRIWLPKDVEASKVFQIREPPFLPFEYKGSIRKFFGSGERSRK
ncbi:hypothetical protein K501DRAFT_331589 [Backusella circina FSU 941]|nr:hypothetical protein K501DRAFT_331589 [Backusella circina FSU 941]